MNVKFRANSFNLDIKNPQLAAEKLPFITSRWHHNDGNGHLVIKYLIITFNRKSYQSLDYSSNRNHSQNICYAFGLVYGIFTFWLGIFKFLYTFIQQSYNFPFIQVMYFLNNIQTLTRLHDITGTIFILLSTVFPLSSNDSINICQAHG